MISQNHSVRYWHFKLVSIFVTAGIFASSKYCVSAQTIKIKADNTLGSENSVVTHTVIDGQPTDKIDGGAIRGTNLFHSFEQFSVDTGRTAYFNNTSNIQNIISRVTGKSISNIDGILKANPNGTANLFLINPNGIIFGPNASLDIRGSFVGSTASSVNFADGIKFSAIEPQAVPLLKISVPIGLQFGPTAATIRNQSQASPGGAINSSGKAVGLEVQPSKTLALVGGDLLLDGGNLTAKGGRIELGSVSNNTLVSLNSTEQGFSLGYKGVNNFQNIQLINSSNVDASGDDGGNIQVQGKNVQITGSSIFTNTLKTQQRGNLTVTASDMVELSVGNTLGVGSIGGGIAGDLTITTGKLIIKDGAQVFLNNSNSVLDSVPQLTVNASDSVELIGGASSGNFFIPSTLSTTTYRTGNAGNITINTPRLNIEGGATISTESSGRLDSKTEEFQPATGKAGDLNITAGSIVLNEGQIISSSQSGKGGNITLNVHDLLLMRRDSQISTNAETALSSGDGGNITINAASGFVVAAPLENNDITANGFSGSGGQITINVKSIFGFVPRTRADLARLLHTDEPKELDPSKLPTSDITAFSQQNPFLNGRVQINSPDVDPSKGLVQLPINLVDASNQIVADCNSAGKTARSSFIVTGRGGVAADPTQPLISDDAVLADWITPSPDTKNASGSIHKRVSVQAQGNTEEKLDKLNYINEPTQIVEAQGWVMDADGNVVLVAQVPTTTPHKSLSTGTSCLAH